MDLELGTKKKKKKDNRISSQHSNVYVNSTQLKKQKLCNTASIQKAVNYSLLGWQEAMMMKVLASILRGK